MSKLKAKILLILLLIILACSLTLFFTLQKQFNSTTFCIIFGALLLITTAAIVLSGIKCAIMHYDGISMKSISKDNTITLREPSEQVVVFLPIPPEEIHKIDTEYNIIDLLYKKVSYKDSYILNIKQNNTILFSSKNSDIDISLDNTKKVQLFMENHTNLSTKDTGLYITVNVDKSLLSQSMKKHVGNEILHVTLQDGKLLLTCKYIRFYSSELLNNSAIKDPYGQEEFEQILRYKVKSTSDKSSVRPLYDIIAIRILSNCPPIDNDNDWAKTEGGKIAIRFFSMFDAKRMLYGQELSNKQLAVKLKAITDYITNITFKGNMSYDDVIFNQIKNLYLEKCDETTEYHLLYKNRYISNTGKRISDKIHENIKKNKLYKYICAIASQDSKNPLSQKTNEFLHNILFSETPHLDIAPLMSNPNEREEIMASLDQSKNEELCAVLKELLGSSTLSYDVFTLIQKAKDYIMKDCKQHMNLLYCEKYYQLNAGYVDNITICSSATKSPSIVNNTDIKNPSYIGHAV
ncbi:hypothetical protein IMW63_02040 [Ehrlichia ruminantium]|uniref:hypothetical protein n=1 Tax=Ehrlichia ruminantium TaxID=779 RepID=UPI001FB54059|nr:hypothetical protein [Ehrlichia ruminantium]UOD99142.1 hypothetical protein IMW63_02040 [Ehrlichia ruminantium]